MSTNNKDLSIEIEKLRGLRDIGNLQSIRSTIGEPHLKKLLLDIYTKYTTCEIEIMTNIPDSTLSYWLKTLKIKNSRWHIKTLARAGSSNYEEIVNSRGKFRRRFTVEMTPDLAYLVGFSLGDGSIQRYVVEFFNKDKGLYNYLNRILKSYGKIKEKKMTDYGLWTFRLNDIKIANLIKKNGKINRETIDYILSRREFARKFIAAFWDAEGHLGRQNNYFHIYLYNTNKYLINKIGRFLKIRKIKFPIHSRFDSERQYSLKGRPINTKKMLHRISIPKKHFGTWAREIGVHMEHSKKKQIVKEILSLNR